MEGDTSDVKDEDSFEILPHLSEYDIFMETQKYRFLNKYGTDFTPEANFLSTSSAWNISEIEFYDIRKSLLSESDIISKSSPDPDETISRNQPNETLISGACIQEPDHHCKTHENSILRSKSELNESDFQLVPYSHDVEYFPKEKMELNTESGRNLHIEFQLNKTGIVENFSDKIMSTIANDNYQIVSDNLFYCDEDENLARKDSTRCNSGNENGTDFMSCEEKTKNKAVVKIYRGRSKSSKRICQVVANGLKLYKWFQGKQIVSTVMLGAKSSFDSIMNLFEVNLNGILEMEERLKLTIVTEEPHCKGIEEAFSAIFRGQMAFSRLIPIRNSIPTLPVGLLAGVQAAETKIHCARQQVGDAPLISTSTMIYEAIPQRWQMTTVICIDDPKFNLQMHNFTLSTPIPNEYVAEADRCTPPSYPHINLGLAISLEQAISNLRLATVKDSQEFLTGFNSYTTLKSAVLVLAGMYEKYV